LPLKRVLVTHPDERGGERFASPLVRSGQFAVKVVHDGFSAALLLVRETFDAIMLHPRTPGMDLRRALSEIRGQTTSKEAGIIVILGQMDDPDRSILRRAGVMEFCSEQQEEVPSLLAKVEAAAGIERTASRRGAGSPPLAKAPARAAIPKLTLGVKPAVSPPSAEALPGISSAAASGAPSGVPGGAASAAAPGAPSGAPRGVASNAPSGAASGATPGTRPGTPPGAPSRAAKTPSVPAHLRSSSLAPHRAPLRNRPTVTVQDRISGHLSLVAREGCDLAGLPPRVSRLDFLIPDMRGDLVSKEVLAIDLSLAVTVLRMANSVTFGTRSPILGLGRALTRIGQRTLASHFLDKWKARQDVPFVVQGFLLSHAWRHNLMVACLAEEISRCTKQGAPDACFSAGLLHDVGKMLMVQHYPDEFLDIRYQRRNLEQTHPDDAVIRRMEVGVVGVDHGMLGYELCQGWNLPPVVSVGTLHHHVGTEGPWMKLHPRVTRTVAVANLIDHHVERLEQPRSPHTEESLAVDPESGAARILRPEPRDIPYLRVTPLPRAVRGVAVPVRALQSFPRADAPEWVTDFLAVTRLPVVRIYERAQRRLYRASVHAGMEAA